MSTPKLVMQPQASKVGWLGSQLPLNGTGDFTVARASTATRINSLGLLETVPANVPIIDHSNGCPELVVEPQVTQLFTNSENLSNGWGFALDTGATGTYTPNYGISLDGTMNAGRLQLSVNTGIYADYSKNITVLNATQYTYSIWLKSLVGNTGIIFLTADNNKAIVVSNQWVRHIVTFTSNSTSIVPRFLLYSGSCDILISKPQLQTGSVATSYIPNATTGTVTKVADVITGQTNVNNFNSAEGTLFVDIKSITNLSGDFRMIMLSDGTINNSINIYHIPNNNMVKVYSIVNGITKLIHEDYSTNINEFHKVAITYNSLNIKMYVNGVEKASSTGGSFSTLTKIHFTDELGLNYPFQGRMKSLKYYPTALTAAQIQAL